jgi:hypothetical protein
MLYTEILPDDTDQPGITKQQFETAISVWTWMQRAMRRPPLQPRLPRSTRPQRLSANVCAPRNGCSLTGLTPIRPSSILTRAKPNRGHLEVIKAKVVELRQ